jgi:hypothetical protein
VEEDNYMNPDMIDETEDNYDTSVDVQDSQLDQYSTFSMEKEKSDLYSWFWRVVGLMKPFKLIKVANLNNVELGEPGISIRDSMNLAHLGTIFKHHKFAQYWANRAKVISVSSMAKKGWFMDLSISQRRIRERQREQTDVAKKKWGMFKKRN